MHMQRKLLRQSIKLYGNRFPEIPSKTLDEWVMAIDHTEAFLDNVMDQDQIDHVLDVLDMSFSHLYEQQLQDAMKSGGGSCTIPDLLGILCGNYMHTSPVFGETKAPIRTSSNVDPVLKSHTTAHTIFEVLSRIQPKPRRILALCGKPCRT